MVVLLGAKYFCDTVVAGGGRRVYLVTAFQCLRSRYTLPPAAAVLGDVDAISFARLSLERWDAATRGFVPLPDCVVSPAASAGTCRFELRGCADVPSTPTRYRLCEQLGSDAAARCTEFVVAGGCAPPRHHHIRPAVHAFSIEQAPRPAAVPPSCHPLGIHLRADAYATCMLVLGQRESEGQPTTLGAVDVYAPHAVPQPESMNLLHAATGVPKTQVNVSPAAAAAAVAAPDTLDGAHVTLFVSDANVHTPDITFETRAYIIPPASVARLMDVVRGVHCARGAHCNTWRVETQEGGGDANVARGRFLLETVFNALPHSVSVGLDGVSSSNTIHNVTGDWGAPLTITLTVGDVFVARAVYADNFNDRRAVEQEEWVDDIVVSTVVTERDDGMASWQLTFTNNTQRVLYFWICFNDSDDTTRGSVEPGCAWRPQNEIVVSSMFKVTPTSQPIPSVLFMRFGYRPTYDILSSVYSWAQGTSSFSRGGVRRRRRAYAPAPLDPTLLYTGAALQGLEEEGGGAGGAAAATAPTINTRVGVHIQAAEEGGLDVPANLNDVRLMFVDHDGVHRVVPCTLEWVSIDDAATQEEEEDAPPRPLQPRVTLPAAVLPLLGTEEDGVTLRPLTLRLSFFDTLTYDAPLYLDLPLDASSIAAHVASARSALPAVSALRVQASGTCLARAAPPRDTTTRGTMDTTSDVRARITFDTSASHVSAPQYLLRMAWRHAPQRDVWVRGSGEVVSLGNTSLPTSVTLVPQPRAFAWGPTLASVTSHHVHTHLFDGDETLARAATPRGGVAVRDVRVGDALCALDGRALRVTQAVTHAAAGMKPMRARGGEACVEVYRLALDVSAG